MSEHAWVQENIATYSAGGLDPEEVERLERHIAECIGCAQMVQETRSVDRTMAGLFGGVLPGPMLEERLIRALRTIPRHRRLNLRVVLGVAATILLGIVGWQASLIIQGTHPLQSGSQLMSPSVVSPSDGMSLAAYNSHDVGQSNQNQTASADELAQRLRSEVLVEDSSSEPLNSLGYYPPARALVTKGTSRIDSNLGGSVYKNDAPANTPPGININNIAGGTSGGIGGGGGAGGGLSPKSGAGGQQKLAAPVPSSWLNLANGGKPALNYFNGEPPGQGGWQPESGPNYFKPGELASLPPNSPSPAATKPADSEWRTRNIVPEDGDRKPLSVLAQKAQKKAIDPWNPFEPQLTDAKGAERSFDARGTPRRTMDLGVETKSGGERKSPLADGELIPPPANQATDKTGDKPATEPQTPPSPRKIIIRSGDIEFEIQSFDAALAAVTLLANSTKGAFVDTVNSEKLPNGKVRGSVVVRVPPEHLDTFILNLRKELGKTGELKNLRVGSQDITKQYTDMESRLRAARTMEERLLQIIKTGKGEIKDLLQAEKELGVWRTKIEEIEGELRYYGNLVSLSTLTITLYEKEIRSPFALVETERVQMGIEVEDVDKALQQATAAVTEAKGRVTKSELKQQAAGQYSALLHFEIAPESAGPLRDRLRQLGTVARLEIDRLQEQEGGTGKPQDARSKRNDTQFFVSLYNLANVAPREMVQINLASPDVEAAYRTILARVQKSTGRVVSSNLNRQRNDQTSATIQFEVKAAEADAAVRDLKEAGELLRLQSTENPDAANVTRSKRGFSVQLVGLGLVTPRESANVTVATRDVPAGYRALQDAIAKIKTRVLNAVLNEQDKQNITAELEFEIRRADEAAVEAALAKAGDVFARNVTRAPDGDNVLDSLVRLHVSLINVTRIPPRETVVLGLEVANVDTSAATFSALVHESQGRTVESHVAHERSGRVTAKLIFDVPLASAPSLGEKFRSAGTVRVLQTSRNTQVPEGPLATARYDVTLSNAELIVPSDDGLWPQIRRGLATSFVALSWSLTVVIVGICFVLPWALIAYAIYRIVVRWRRQTGVNPVP
jgi:hypothetical protein